MKKFVFRILCNEFTGKVISWVFQNNIPNCRYDFKRFKTPERYCSNTIRAMIFWGFYERAEMRLIAGNLDPCLPVIELGASLGIVSTKMISRLNRDVHYTCIEANPYLIEYIRHNVETHNSAASFSVDNVAIAYTDNDWVEMQITPNNTQGRIAYDNQVNNYASVLKVKASTLTGYAKSPYTLISDIEGMEIEVFKNDAGALKNCRHLFIELHKTWYNGKCYEIGELEEIIINDLGFEAVRRDGNVFYFAKPANS